MRKIRKALQTKKFICNRGVDFYFVVSFSMLALLLGAGGVSESQDVQQAGAGQDVQQVGGGIAPVSQDQNQAGEFQAQPQELADIEEGQMIAFDPETVPDSLPGEDAVWNFRVPVSVQNISSHIQRIGLLCETFGYVSDQSPIDPGRVKHRIGEAKKRIDLVNGGFSGNVMMGLNPLPGEDPVDAVDYDCYIFLIDSEGHWNAPCENCSIPYLRADENYPFKWKLGAQDIF